MTGARAERSRMPVAALGFAAAAALSSWNPLSAPFGLAVGIAALGLGVRALRAGASRRGSAAAIALSALAAIASAAVLALTAGVGRDLGGEPLVEVKPGAAEAELEAAEARTRAARERALRELRELEPPPPGGSGKQAQGGDPPPAGGGPADGR